MKRILLLASLLIVTWAVPAQDQQPFYATMALHDAYALKAELPDQVVIFDKNRNEAAVSITNEAAMSLERHILVHGPGYIYQPDLEAALQHIQTTIPRREETRMAFTITEDALVLPALDLVQLQNLEDHMIELENYGTRFHDRTAAEQAAIDLKAKWEAMAALYGRTDVSVRLYEHNSTPMPSVILTIEGSQLPDEYVIVGAHLDSTSSQGNHDAPGADDDASGIATITEAVRVLFEVGFVPKRTVEVMAYAAEEIGLVGSGEIAQEYGSNNVDVLAYVQFDMTNYQGSGMDVYFVSDYTSASLNGFLTDLMGHYNSSGDHSFTHGTTLCNYGCSDHASWHNQGYMAAFPFESSFGQHNPNIHTPFDTFDFIGTAQHAAKFTKLCVEFIAETAKNDSQLGVGEAALDYIVYSDLNTLYYDFGTEVGLERFELFGMLGNRLRQLGHLPSSGRIDLEELPAGIYVLVFITADNRVISQKVVLR